MGGTGWAVRAIDIAGRVWKLGAKTTIGTQEVCRGTGEELGLGRQ